MIKKVGKTYHRGPRGGGMSKAEKPLIQIRALPSPVLRIYCQQQAQLYRCIQTIVAKNTYVCNMYFAQTM